MISLILTESSLELVPKELSSHPSVISHAQKLGKRPSEILLDNSWHFAAMKGISDEIKRGRPDLVHFCILEATTIPLYTKNKIKIYIHTIDDKVIYVGENVHIPKSYHRFEGLIEKLFLEKTIESGGNTLLEIKDRSFLELIDEIIIEEQFESIKASVKETVIGDKINLLFEIQETDKFFVERINILGNNITDEKVIRNQLDWSVQKLQDIH